MNIANKYTIEIMADAPPRLCIGDDIAGGRVVAIASDQLPDIVSATWLADRFGISKGTVTRKLAQINIGTAGKHAYHREQAVLLLTDKNRKRGRPRVN